MKNLSELRDSWESAVSAVVGSALTEKPKNSDIASALASVARQYIPDRLSKAYWVTMRGSWDKGMEIRLHEFRFPWWHRPMLRLGALLGGKSAGLDLTTKIFPGLTKTLANGGSVPEVRIGVGLTSHLQGKFRPEGSIVATLRF